MKDGASHPVLQLESQRCRALERGDIGTVEAMLSPRLVYVHAPGTVHDRNELLTFLRTQVRFQSVERAGMTLEVHGDVAWLTGFMRLAGQRLANGADFTSVSFATQVWCREADAVWRLAVFQSTRIDEALWPG